MMINNTDKTNSGIKQKLVSAFCDPVLIYTVLIMMAVMYHYRSSLTLVYGIASLLVGAVIFRIFDYIAKHKLMGTVVYIAVFAVFMVSARLCIDVGSDNYPISFGVWFLTPQDALDYSRWYTLAIYLIFMIFNTSVIYYFTKVRYRIFMNFMIFIIPFALYGKEYEQMPTLFIILLTIGYIVIMIKCRQISESENTVIIGSSRLWKSAAVYVVMFASIAAIIPKPFIEADRRALDTMLAADAFTDRLLATLSVFSDTSSNDNFGSQNDDRILYYVSADRELRLKTRTYSTYNYEDDTWSVSTLDTRFNFTTDDRDIILEKPGQLLQAIGDTAENYKYLLRDYGLEKLDLESIVLPDEKKLRIHTAGSRAQFAPVPTELYSLDSSTYDGEIALLHAGTIYCANDWFGRRDFFEFTYTSAEEFLKDENNKAIVDYISALSDEEYQKLLNYCLLDHVEEENQTYHMINAHNRVSRNFDAYLDYGDNTRISELAAEITAGIDSDYDKAKAIESYFLLNNYKYDSSYRKDKGDNVEDFIFKSKKGVCFEYATAMVLLARACGIPARYAEGYNMSEKYVSNMYSTNYLVKAKDAHGYPELYIKGLGWVSFEPTVPDTSLDESASDSAGKSLSKAGIFILIAALLFFIAMKLYPVVSHKWFLIRIRRTESNEAVILVMQRICRLCGISSKRTSHEAAEEIYTITGADTDIIAELFDKTAYGSFNAADTDKQTAVESYMALYRKIKENKKRRNKKK